MLSVKRKSLANKAGLILAVIIIAASVTVSLSGNWNRIYNAFGLGGVTTFVASEGVSVHFIDVGQGDSALIITQESYVLIDSGEWAYYATVLNYLQSQDVHRLDYIIATHPHSDHIGSMSYIVSELDVRRIIKPQITDELIPVTGAYLRLLDAIEANNVEIIWAVPGDIFGLCDNSTLEILGPLRDYDRLNDYSVVSRFTYFGSSFLFTGDIERTAESDLADYAYIRADVLHVAHHGSATSGTAKFLNAVAGSHAVISVGSPNSYNHPRQEVLDRLTNRDYLIYRTDRHGHIVFDVTSEGFEVFTEKGG